MNYFYYKEFKNHIHSIDMVRVVLEFREDSIYKIQFNLIDNINRPDIVIYPKNFTAFKYQYLFKIPYNESSLVLGVGFNGCSKEDYLKGYLEFNPNKVLQDNRAFQDIRFIISCCWKASLRRLDYAIDIPFDRNNVFLFKDSRSYRLDYNSFDDRTEYLGRRSNNGFVKVYNKSIESQLDYNLTRIEITYDSFDYKSFLTSFPKIRILADDSKEYNLSGLNQTNKLLVEYMLHDSLWSEKFNALRYETRKKLEPYLTQKMEELKPQYFIFTDLVEKLLTDFNLSVIFEK